MPSFPIIRLIEIGQAGICPSKLEIVRLPLNFMLVITRISICLPAICLLFLLQLWNRTGSMKFAKGESVR